MAADLDKLAREIRKRFMNASAAFVRELVRREAELQAITNGVDFEDTIASAPNVALAVARMRKRMIEIEGRVGRLLPNVIASAERARPSIEGVTAQRRQTAARIDPGVRLRARTEAARENVIVQVRVGLERGASVRQMAIDIARTDTVRVPIPAYVESVVEALRAGVSPRELAALAGPVRQAAARMGSATDAQSWRTMKPLVTKLADAVAAGHIERATGIANEYVERRLRFEAGRIARTEAARAASQAQIETARNTPGVEALEWRLSGQHPVDDICDMWASLDLHGLGPGRYPVDGAPELPAHPNCLCTLVPVVTAESIARAIRGEPPPERGEPTDVSPNAWLRQQPASVQRNIVGVGNAQRLREGANVISGSGQIARLTDRRVRTPTTVQVTGGVVPRIT